MTLYDKTHLRGSSVKIYDSVDQMTDELMKDLMTSFSISGTSCWILYDKPNFQGRQETFRPGEYKSATQLGFFFKNIQSIKKVDQC